MEQYTGAVIQSWENVPLLSRYAHHYLGIIVICDV